MNMPMRSPTVFLDRALEPIRAWLFDDQVVEICANGPGAVWVERFGQAAMERHDVPELTEAAIRHLTERVAGHSGQSVNEEHPLLSAALPTGERFQGVLPPATTGGGAFAIRKQVIKDMRLDDYRKLGAFTKVSTLIDGALSETDRCLCEHLDAGRIEDFIRLAVVSRYSILLSGGTSSGKTTFLNAILKEVPAHERIVTIEDTREVVPIQSNFLPLVASKGDQGEARVTVETLLQATMRMRPDRIFLGEIRGAKPIRSCGRSTPVIPAASRPFTPTVRPAPSSSSRSWSCRRASACATTRSSATSRPSCRSSSNRPRSADGGEPRPSTSPR